MLELEGEFGYVRLGGGPQGAGIYWIDDLGNWNKFDPRLPEGIDNQNLDRSLRDRNIAFGPMQMVRVAVDTDRRHIDVSWNVRTAHSHTLNSVSNYLDVFGADFSVTLNYCIEAWHQEWHHSASQAVGRIQRTRNFRSLPIIDKVFLKQIDFDWSRNMSPLINTGVQRLDRSKGDLRKEELQPLIPKTIVYKPCEKTGQMVVVNAGYESAYASIYGDTWVKSATGQTYDSETPGEYFSARVSAAYQHVLQTGVPRLDHIRGIVNRPKDAAIWSSYQRLLFRGRWHDGCVVLICLCDLTQHLDIPFIVDDGHIN